MPNRARYRIYCLEFHHFFLVYGIWSYKDMHVFVIFFANTLINVLCVEVMRIKWYLFVVKKVDQDSLPLRLQVLFLIVSLIDYTIPIHVLVVYAAVYCQNVLNTS